MYNRTVNRRGDSDGWFDEETLDDPTMDVDEGNMDFSNAYVNTEVDHLHTEVQDGLVGCSDVEAEVESHISSNISEDDKMSDCMSGDDNTGTVLSRNMKRMRRVVTTAISALCYSRTTRSNLLQAQMGHYFLCARTPKRPVEVTHQLGISVSYSSITKALKAIALSVKESV